MTFPYRRQTVLLLMLHVGNLVSLGQGAQTFLIEPDARYLAMGAAGTGLADDVNAVFWNPAGLAFQQGVESSFTAMTLHEEIQFRRAAARYGTQSGNALGVAIWTTRWSSRSCLTRRYRSACYNDARDLTVSISIAHRVTNSLAIGLSLKPLRMRRWAGTDFRSESREDWSVAFDVAAMYTTEPYDVLGYPGRAAFGANFANAGSELEDGFPARERVLPGVLRLGSALEARLDSVRTVRMVADVALPLVHAKAAGLTNEASFSNVMGGIGVEYPFDKYLTFRAGLAFGQYQFHEGINPTMGGGVSLGTLRLDVSCVTGLDYVHVVTRDVRFTIRIGREDTTMPAFPRGRVPSRIE